MAYINLSGWSQRVGGARMGQVQLNNGDSKNYDVSKELS